MLLKLRLEHPLVNLANAKLLSVNLTGENLASWISFHSPEIQVLCFAQTKILTSAFVNKEEKFSLSWLDIFRLKIGKTGTNVQALV